MTEEQGQAPPAGRFLGWLASSRWRPLAVAALTLTIGVAAMIGLREPAAPSSRYVIGESGSAPQHRAEDPLRAELIRCRGLPANVDDARCRAAWEVNRRRFFGESRSLILPPMPQPDALPAARAANGER